MIPFRFALGAAAIWFAGAGLSARAASITVNLDSGNFTLKNEANVLLSAGQTGVEGDGFVLQLGYYSAATTSDNFAGTWVPLTGQGSANTAPIAGSSINLNQTTVGDLLAFEGGADGTFALAVKFDTAVAAASQNLPSVGVPLAIRFYNAASLAGATYFNAVSNDSWVWQAPANAPNSPVLTFSLNDVAPNLEWQSIALGQNASTAFQTAVLVPEPTSTLLTLGGLAALCGCRRRKSAA